MYAFLVIAGLLCDLIGAFLLSLPMVWNTRRAAHRLLRMIQKARWFLYGPPYVRIDYERGGRGPAPFAGSVNKRLTAIVSFFSLWFLLSLLRTVYLSLFSGKDFEFYGMKNIGHITLFEYVLSFFISLIMILAIFGTAAMISKIPVGVARFFLYVNKGDREQKFGLIGLVILCAGFLIQAYVNLHPWQR